MACQRVIVTRTSTYIGRAALADWQGVSASLILHGSLLLSLSVRSPTASNLSRASTAWPLGRPRTRYRRYRGSLTNYIYGRTCMSLMGPNRPRRLLGSAPRTFPERQLDIRVLPPRLLDPIYTFDYHSVCRRYEKGAQQHQATFILKEVFCTLLAPIKVATISDDVVPTGADVRTPKRRSVTAG